MELSCETVKNTLLVKLSGELDLHTAEKLRHKLSEALDKGGARHLVCDCAGVTFIDSSGLAVLLGRYRQLAALGGSVTLKNPRPQVYRILEFSGLNKIMTIEKPPSLGAPSYKEERR